MERMLSCIILSAGLSRRFGSPKALAPLHGLPAIERVQNTLVRSLVDDIVVVLGAEQEKIKPHILNHKKIKVVYNKDYNLGQTSSFKAGVRACSAHTKGIMLLPVDFPALKTETIDALIDCFMRDRPTILIPTYEQKKGHPPIFNAAIRDDLCALSDAVGLHTLQRRADAGVQLHAIDDESVIATFNTPAELEALRARFR